MGSEKVKTQSEVRPLRLAAVVALGVLIAFIPPSAALSAQAMQFLGICAAMIVGMMINAAPMWAMTSLAALTAIILKIATFEEIYSQFAGTTIWMILGVVAFASCLSESGLMRRIAFSILKLFPASFSGQVLAILSAGTVLGPLIPSATAKLAVMAPFSAQLAKDTGIKPHSRGMRGLFFIMFSSAFLSTPMFLTATNMNFIMLGMLPQEVAAEFTWVNWFKAAGVWGAVLLLLSAIFTILFLKPDEEINISKEFTARMLAEMGPMSTDEKVGLATLAGAMLLWLTANLHGISSAVVAWLALLVMHFAGQFKSADIMKKMPWGLVLMFGPMMGFVSLMEPLGVTQWLAGLFSGVSALIPNALVFVLVFVPIIWALRLVIDQFSVLAISIAVFGPIASGLGINLWVVVFLAWANAQQWLLPHSNVDLLQTLEMTGSDVIVYKDVRLLSFVYMVIGLIASIASVPVWRLLNLL